MIASSESPLYQPSIQVSTILMVSSPPSTNCLQVMVERSRTTACAGADDSMSVAANRIEAVVFMMNSIGVRGRRLACDADDFRKKPRQHVSADLAQTKFERLCSQAVSNPADRSFTAP